MIDRRLQRQLDEVAMRYRRMRAATWLAVAWIVLATVAAVLVSLNHTVGFYVRGEAVAFVVIGSLVTLGVLLLATRAGRDPHWIARRIESKYPQLEARLLTAIEQHPDLPDGRFGYLQTQVIQEAVFHGYRNDWRRTMPSQAYLASLLAGLLAAGTIVAATVGLFRYLEPQAFSLAPLLNWDRQGDPPIPTRLVSVDPGDTSIERGTSLLVLAKFAGPLPLECALETSDSSDTGGQQIKMSQSLKDPVFAGRVPAVEGNFRYRVCYAGESSPDYQVTVFEYPTLLSADAVIDFPDYTSLDTKTVQDVRHITAVEGTIVTLLCHLNKEVVRAQLRDEEAQAIQLEPDSTTPTTYTVTFPLTTSQRLFLHLEDDAGRTNKLPSEFVITVTPNRRAELELAFPSRDVEVSPIEELQLVARIWDDYGLSRAGVTYQLGDAAPQEATLGTSITTKGKTPVTYLLPFEDLQAQPNQLLAYYFWAEDIDANGQTRRTMSDMFFAEVRPLDEIYRQGQQPPGESSSQQRQQQQGQGPQGAGNQVQQLAEQQKEIINATWNILRRADSESVSAEFREDVAVVRDTQSTLHDRLAELAPQINDAQAQRHITTLAGQMQQAVAELTRATDEALVTPLDTALRAERAAYQTLLQLRAREHEVIRSNMQNAQQARSGGASGNRSRQQLQQLALSNNENRYETQREAAPQQENPAQSEQRQLLNRLRELARRQNDLNKRLQELQAELEQAENDQEREELLKQLKRLREQQQDILRDTDELNSRMNQAENQPDMSEPQQRLQQARENVRQASAALEEGRVSQALSAGTRAQRELDDLRDDFRQRTSEQFVDEARDLQRQADELAQKQRELGQQLNQQNRTTPDEPRSLRDASPREELLQQMQQQNERLDNLLEQMQQTVKEAEEPQPLLAEQLYDSYRQARQDRLSEKMRETERSMRRGLLDDARQLESSAREGIERLRDSIQQAAKSVLGDENEALRRARDELNELSQELHDEMRRAAPPSREATPATDPDRNTPRPDAAGDSSGREPNALDAEPDRSRPGSSRRVSDEPQDQQDRQPRGSQRPESQQEPQQPGSSPESGANPAQPDGAAERPEERRDPNGRQRDSQPSTPERSEPRGNRQGSADQQRPGALRRDSDGAPRLRGGNRADNVQPGRPERGAEVDRGPLTGSAFRDWADRLRDVEDMISDPELKSDAARIRDRAKEIRSDLVRHSQEPNWDLVRLTIAQPLSELRDRIGEELEKRISKKALVPIDRDPVPTPYVEQVRRYYERIGSGE